MNSNCINGMVEILFRTLTTVSSTSSCVRCLLLFHGQPASNQPSLYPTTYRGEFGGPCLEL